MLLLDPCQSERHMLPLGSMVSAMPKLLLLAMSGPMVLLQLESILMSIDYITLLQGPTMCQSTRSLWTWPCHS